MMVLDLERRFISKLPARLVYRLDQLRGPETSSWTNVVEWLVDNEVTTVGFDVYDTLLTRQINHQQAYLEVLARTLTTSGAWTGTADDYMTARQSAMKRVPGENLTNWYRHPELACQSDAASCIQGELELEESLTEAIPDAIDALDRIRAEGIDVCFISDMHLPTEFVADLLYDHELRQGEEPLLVSGDVGSWKSSGELFKQWQDTVKLQIEHTAYVGNHPFVDQAVPRSLGFKVKGRRSGNPVRYERRMAESGVAGAVVAAASTRARLEADGTEETTGAEIGAAVAGQTMLSFLLAIRARCNADNIRQVVFMARDGELPFRMADAMPKDYWSSIDTHYIHGNRLTLALAGAHHLGIDDWLALNTADEHSFLRTRAQATPLKRMLGRLDLQIDELPESAVRLLDADPHGSEGVGEETWLRVLHDEEVKSLVANRSAERLALVTNYVQSLELRNELTLIVDVGWRGQTSIVVSGVFADVLGVEPIHYHFGGYGVRPEIDCLARIERYAFDDGKEPIPFRGVDQCVELFTGAGQPRAVGYHRQNDSIAPILDSGVEALSTGARADIWAYALRTAACLPAAERLDLWTDEVPDRSAVVDVLRQFWLNPGRSEAKLSTELQIEADDRGAAIMSVSSAYGLRDLWSPSPRRWAEGSLAASRLPIRLMGSARRGRS